MLLIDTHCHLDFPVFDGDREKVLTRCQNKNIVGIIQPGIQESFWRRQLAIGSAFDRVFNALGLHPCFMESHQEIHLQTLEACLGKTQDNIVAVGEIGLDFFIKKRLTDHQIHYFTDQLAIAEKFRLPVILHVRKAHDRVIAILKNEKFSRRGIVHCYSGSVSQAKAYLNLGFALGIGGRITYDRSLRLQKVARELPLSSFVLETDAPDIPIRENKGARNSPEFLPAIRTAFAHYRTEGDREITHQLYRNSTELFPDLES